MTSNSPDEKQADAEEEHRQFVDTMFSCYGIEKHPGYFPITIRPLLSAGGLGHATIYLCDDLDPKRLPYVIWHESSHYLHRIVNPALFAIPEEKREFFLAVAACEMIAELAALLYLKSYADLAPATLIAHSIGNGMNDALEDREIDALIKIARTSDQILEELVSLDGAAVVKRVCSYSGSG
ncbi:hypothetical protein J4210_01970 [Candidatus Woesearchaeota archaeon]|nr:hypothetical protein [Candidatus Woesearchaeota archaeon]